MTKLALLKNNSNQVTAPCSLMVKASQEKNTSPSLVFSAITLTNAVWRPGDKGTITITFGDYPSPECDPAASWSQIGKESNGIIPSMNLGFVDPPFGPWTDADGKKWDAPPLSVTRNYCAENGGPNTCRPGWIPGATVVHEFGHALGMMHEHQNNLNNANPIKINLNKQNVINYYVKLTGNYDDGEQQAETNVLEFYSDKGTYAGTKYDPESIMLYSLPDNWVKGKNPTRANFKLSNQDKDWLKSLYPKSQKNQPVLTVKFVDRNPEPWKMAWVKYVILKEYNFLGIKWNFDIPKLPDTKPPGITKSLSKVKPPSMKTITEKFAIVSEGSSKFSPENLGYPIYITALFFIVVLVFVFIGLCIKYNIQLPFLPFVV